MEWKRAHYGKIAFDNVLILYNTLYQEIMTVLLKITVISEELITCDKGL